MLTRLLITLALASSAVLSLAEEGKRMNVLFLMADDLNAGIGCYGHPLVKTPNIDRLAARGVRFNHTYCQYPLCGPSRNSMLTGLQPNSTGILTNSQLFRQTIPSAIPLPQAFRLAGYFAVRIGKMYHYGVPVGIGTNGHDDPASWEVEMNPAGCDRLDEEPDIFSLVPGQFGGTLSWLASKNPDSKQTDGLMASDAEWVLERCAKQTDRPFFVALGFYRPHTPYVAPAPYFEGYPEAKMPVVQGVKEDQADIPAPGLGSAKKEQDAMSDDLRRQAVQAYFASITFMDAQLGHVLDALDRLGLADSTIITFTSDHGYHLGEHGLWQKQSLFEESARVPMIIAAPGISGKGTVAETPVGLIDLYPTLAELCNVKAPENLQGQSLVPILKDPTEKGRGWAITTVTRGGGKRNAKKQGVPRFHGYSLRTPKYRYTEWDGGAQGRELYDHEKDPQELTNLAEDPAHAATIAELSTQLQAAAKATFPADGIIPAVLKEGGMWSPNLTNPGP